jgi:nitroreductase
MKRWYFIVCMLVGISECSNAMSSDSSTPQMGAYNAIYNRRMVRDFKKEVVSQDVVKRVIGAGLQAPSHDHLRNWEFIVLQTEEEKKNCLQFIKDSIGAQLAILDKILVDGTPQQKMYADGMPKQYSMLYNASHIILPFFKADEGLMHPTNISSFNSISSIWCAIQNMFIAAIAEGLGCSMRIPTGDEGPNIAKLMEHLMVIF